MSALADRLRPCGPVTDDKAAARAKETLADHWTAQVEVAWPALAPALSASPYMAGIVRRSPGLLAEVLAADPSESLESALAQAEALADEPALDVARKGLRLAKRHVHLLAALCDLGGVWGLDEITGALTRLADTGLRVALAQGARAELARGRITRLGAGDEGRLPGFIILALGKQGGFELNYSSDIDPILLFDPELTPVAEGVDPQAVATSIAQHMVATLAEKTADGYVFRVDLRLRPDPSTTPAAVAVPEALSYYESVGQNWERAAFIKARQAAGDRAAGKAFLDEMSAFVWRRNLDYEAISDIHSIKRQIHAYKTDERLTAAGHDLKLGAGGIREIEFFVQTQQLILGGRHPELRSPRTLDALKALEAEGHVSAQAAEELRAAYVELRGLEHRVQIIADEQTHRLPQDAAGRKRVAALYGYDRLQSFDAAVGRILRTVNGRYSELFAGEESLSSRFGSLVFTGVDDDPETLATLKRMGFSDPAAVSQRIRGWHHGRINATRTARGRELFTRLGPRLLDAAQATGASDAAFSRFGDFFEGMSGGVQAQALLLAQPKLLELLVRVLALSPWLAGVLGRRPAALDAMLDPEFFQPFDPDEERAAFAISLKRTDGFEGAMDAARRLHRETMFRLGVQVLSGAADAQSAGRGFADLADLIVQALAPAALTEAERLGGGFPGQVAVIGLGKAGSRELNAGSDLDLMTLYRADSADAMSAVKGWGAETFFGRFTQRLIAALSAPTAEGTLYEVDMRLRPTGSQGPVAVSRGAFENYYSGEAETWEFLALTRARVIWASSPDFEVEATGLIEAALRQPRDRKQTAKDVREMRDLMRRERPASGFWDMKLGPGGLVDIEFVAQHLQIVHAAQGGPLAQNTGEALTRMASAGLGPADGLGALHDAWRLQQDLTQTLKVALTSGADPESEPAAFRRLLAKVGGAKSLDALKRKLSASRAAAAAVYKTAIV